MSAETVEAWKGINVECEMYYQPEEKQTWDYPGCPAEYYIECVLLNGEDITDNLSGDFLETLLERIKGNNEPDWEYVVEARDDARRARRENEA